MSQKCRTKSSGCFFHSLKLIPVQPNVKPRSLSMKEETRLFVVVGPGVYKEVIGMHLNLLHLVICFLVYHLRLLSPDPGAIHTQRLPMTKHETC
ncbi:hypothetical protein XELAEV_18004871mg [Xenopus laevis]|uniref:Uncharacterized protein n=1 Tax=Xenopus laevis TaxID=8355 RepID=A0A974I2L7_XENLA|nr:hypothetical protein XELAEV_18004871mg [Xenopus laevis]